MFAHVVELHCCIHLYRGSLGGLVLSIYRSYFVVQVQDDLDGMFCIKSSAVAVSSVSRDASSFTLLSLVFDKVLRNLRVVLPCSDSQWIGFHGKIETGKPHDLHGKIDGLRFSL